MSKVTIKMITPLGTFVSADMDDVTKDELIGNYEGFFGSSGNGHMRIAHSDGEDVIISADMARRSVFVITEHKDSE